MASVENETLRAFRNTEFSGRFWEMLQNAEWFRSLSATEAVSEEPCPNDAVNEEPNYVLLTRICEQCGVPFLPRDKSVARKYGRKYCSQACHGIASRRDPAVYGNRTCAHCGAMFKNSNRAKKRSHCSLVCKRAATELRRTKPCVQCGKPFMLGRELTANRMELRGAGKYCSVTCAGIARRTASPRIVNCAVCGIEFGKRHGVVWCSEQCWHKAERRFVFASDLRMHTRECIVCRMGFVQQHLFQRHCSLVCFGRGSESLSPHRGVMRVSAVVRHDVDPFVVFERDQWHCYICGEPTPQELRGTYDKRAPELEHIIPLSKGGEHSYANTACACRECNGSKGAKMGRQTRLARRN